MVAEVTGVTKQLHTAEKVGVLDELLLAVVDETFKQVFREAGAKVIYDYLGNKFHLEREEIAKKPEVFSVGLEELLVSARPVIENMIIKSLYSKLELKFAKKKGYAFSDYLKELREKFGC